MNERTTELARTLANASMTVRELRELLDGFDDEARVLVAAEYGDYGRTVQALSVEDAVDAEAKEFALDSGYSRSGVAYVENDDCDAEDDVEQNAAFDSWGVGDFVVLKTNG